MASKDNMTRSLMVQKKHSILGTYYFLGAQFRFMPRAFVYMRVGSNLLLECMHVILKPCYRYNLFTYVIPMECY